MTRKYEYEIVAERVVEDEETSALITRMEREADEELASKSITLRWGPTQIDTVKRAATLFGIPYQTYLKQVVFRQALADIARAEAVLESDGGRDEVSYADTEDARPAHRVAESSE